MNIDWSNNTNPMIHQLPSAEGCYSNHTHPRLSASDSEWVNGVAIGAAKDEMLSVVGMRNRASKHQSSEGYSEGPSEGRVRGVIRSVLPSFKFNCDRRDSDADFDSTGSTSIFASTSDSTITSPTITVATTTAATTTSSSSHFLPHPLTTAFPAVTAIGPSSVGMPCDITISCSITHSSLTNSL